MLDETVETRRPWRDSYSPKALAGRFALHGIISTAFNSLRYSHVILRVQYGAMAAHIVVEIM